jgi:transcriptional regulator with XRE-family HTH domain
MKNSLKKIRKLKGWTLKELSERSGIPLSTIGNFETGRTRVSPKVLKRLSTSLRVSENQILSESLEFQKEGDFCRVALRTRKAGFTSQRRAGCILG